LVKEVSPTLHDQATDRAGARVARLADAASTTLEQVVTGDFPHDRDGAAVARTMHEGARTVFEVLKMVKRPGGNVSVANQVAVAVSATEHSAAVQVRARQILEQHARWERERGRAEALGLPLPPRPVSDVRRIEDAHDESLEADATACVLDGAAPREDEGRSPAERPSGAMASDVGTVAQSPPVPLPGCPVRGADASHHAPRAGEQGADEVDEEVNRDGGDSS
jgi:hypothetical protein